MCVGGSAPKPIKVDGAAFAKQFRAKAKIIKPKRSELRALTDEVRSMTRFLEQQNAPTSRLNRAQAGLDLAQKALQQRLSGMELLATRMANSKAVIQRQALMLATLKGPPPPEPAADAPRLGGSGDPVSWRQTGRHALTIPAESSGLVID